MTVSSAVTAVDLLFGSRKIEGALTGNPATGDATLKFSALTPLCHTRAHIRVPAHLAFSLVGLSVTGAGPGHFAFGSTGADHGLGAECKLIDTGLATLGEIFELLLDRNQEGSRHSSAAQLGNKPFLRRL